MTLYELRQVTGLNKKEFAEKYNIPYRSLQNWEADPTAKNYRVCPEYVLELLEYRIKTEDYLREHKQIKTCCICGGIIIGYGNNPYPLVKKKGARCCNKCDNLVTEERIRQKEE